MNDVGSSWCDTARHSGRERSTRRKGKWDQTISTCPFFLSNLITPAACQGTKGDRGAPGNKGERVSTSLASYVTPREHHGDSVPSVFTQGEAGESGEPGEDVSNRSSFLVAGLLAGLYQ